MIKASCPAGNLPEIILTKKEKLNINSKKFRCGCARKICLWPFLMMSRKFSELFRFFGGQNSLAEKYSQAKTKAAKLKEVVISFNKTVSEFRKEREKLLNSGLAARVTAAASKVGNFLFFQFLCLLFISLYFPPPQLFSWFDVFSIFFSYSFFSPCISYFMHLFHLSHLKSKWVHVCTTSWLLKLCLTPEILNKIVCSEVSIFVCDTSRMSFRGKLTQFTNSQVAMYKDK